MSVAERLGRQILPLLILLGSFSLFVVLDKAPWRLCDEVFFLCGVGAGGVQLLSASVVSSPRRKAAIIILDTFVVNATWGTLVFSEPLLMHVLKIDFETVKFALYPFPQITITGALIAAAVVLLLGFWPSKQNKSHTGQEEIPK